MNVAGDIQVTGAEAAHRVGVATNTIDVWVRRGYLDPIPGTGRPRKFWLSEVYQAEARRQVHWKNR